MLKQTLRGAKVSRSEVGKSSLGISPKGMRARPSVVGFVGPAGKAEKRGQLENGESWS